MASGHIGIFVATMTGLAEICAEEVQAALEGAGFPAEIQLMDGLSVDALDDFDVFVIISSTYGHGDIPDNGQAFFESVSNHGSLAGKRYTVFGLGDRTYADTFCHAGMKWDELFASKGATRISPLERHDASSGTLAEDEAGGWAASWAPDIKKKAA
jgi:MioC protein